LREVTRKSSSHTRRSAAARIGGQRKHLRPLSPEEPAQHQRDRPGEVIRSEVGRIGGATMTVYTNDFQGSQKQIQIQLRGGTPPRSPWPLR
jgi:hypothetical protein